MRSAPVLFSPVSARGLQQNPEIFLRISCITERWLGRVFTTWVPLTQPRRARYCQNMRSLQPLWIVFSSYRSSVRAVSTAILQGRERVTHKLSQRLGTSKQNTGTALAQSFLKPFYPDSKEVLLTEDQKYYWSRKCMLIRNIFEQVVESPGLLKYTEKTTAISRAADSSRAWMLPKPCTWM